MRTGSVSVEHSRALLLAQSATSASPSHLAQRLESSVVAISVDPGLPMSFLTARLLVSTLRRGLGTLVLLRDGLPGPIVQDLEETAAAIDPSRPLRIETALPAEPAVRLHLGTSVPGRAVRAVPEGYGAHIASARTAVIRPSRPGNELGAAYAAALAAAEAFKHTAQVLPARRVLHRHLRFCPVTLSADLSAAPPLPGALTLDLSLIGVGAIGTGIALILSELPAEGKLLAVDRQRFAKENQGTYALGGVAEVLAKPWKTDIAQRTLHRSTSSRSAARSRTCLPRSTWATRRGFRSCSPRWTPHRHGETPSACGLVGSSTPPPVTPCSACATTAPDWTRA
jgi:hypothetical protein